MGSITDNVEIVANQVATPGGFTVTDSVGNGGTCVSGANSTQNLSANAAPSGHVLEFRQGTGSFSTTSSYSHAYGAQFVYEARYRRTSDSATSAVVASITRRVADADITITPAFTVISDGAPTGETTIATITNATSQTQYRVRATGNINGSSVTDFFISAPTAGGSSPNLQANNYSEFPAPGESATYTVNARVETSKNGDGFYRNLPTSNANRSFDIAKSETIVYGGPPPTNRDHGKSLWVAMVTIDSVGFGTNEGNCTITEYNYSTDPVSTTTKVTIGSGPGRGTFSVTQGRLYGCDKPFALLRSGRGDVMVPTSLKGKEFGDVHTRGGNATYRMWAEQDTNVAVFDNVSGGITTDGSGATAYVEVPAYTVTEYVRTTTNANPILFTSDEPMVMSKYGASNDRHVLSPASDYMYYRRENYVKAMDNGNASNNTGNTGTGGVAYDSSDRVFSVGIGDGAGGDSEQGVGGQNISNTYLHPYVLRDFAITTPYDQTVIVESRNSGTFVERATYTFSNSSITSPEFIRRDGDNGFTTTGTNFKGNAAQFNSDTLWRFRGPLPFQIAVNDNSTDEESMFGFQGDFSGLYGCKIYNDGGDLVLSSGDRTGQIVTSVSFTAAASTSDLVTKTTIQNLGTAFDSQVTSDSEVVLIATGDARRVRAEVIENSGSPKWAVKATVRGTTAQTITAIVVSFGDLA